jgi:hypothetical protein
MLGVVIEIGDTREYELRTECTRCPGGNTEALTI